MCRVVNPNLSSIIVTISNNENFHPRQQLKFNRMSTEIRKCSKIQHDWVRKLLYLIPPEETDGQPDRESERHTNKQTHTTDKNNRANKSLVK